ncbi:MAG: phosphoglucomutase, alpha-D-glucose phosphate-specific [Myxococcota bacterium]|nr:phosphoglucomutase, alpha-D-glucose phosphate-specific [Myxococcota bacterium]
MTHELRPGELSPVENLVDLAALERAYFEERPDPENPAERVSFGTSGHRGSSLRRSFNEDHIAAITSAICDWREANGVAGPLFIGMDTHALSEPAHATALEVLAARGVRALAAPAGNFTPTPAVSRAIVTSNRGSDSKADGIVVTPSHNPPEDGGFKYDPPHGGPAEAEITTWIERRANALLTGGGVRTIARVAVERARREGTLGTYDFLTRYVDDLRGAIDVESIAAARPKIGVDPMGGASVQYWARIAEVFGLDVTVVNREIDKRFAFVPLDHDGRIRTDCSSPFAMAKLLAQRSRFDVAVANDADADRHGVVTRSAGLLPPNHYLSIAVDYLFRHRGAWPARAAVGRTAVTSHMIDRVAASLSRQVLEVPVGFKWFVPGLREGSLGFGGEESAGASFLARDGSTWTTDKDGVLLCLLAAEILSASGNDLDESYRALERAHGTSFYERKDAPATRAMRERLRRVRAEDWSVRELAGDPVKAAQTSVASGGDLGGLKVTTDCGWFAVRPSGTEDVYKIYAESFRSKEHLERMMLEAVSGVSELLRGV